MKNRTLSHTYLNLSPFTDDEWDNHDPLYLLEQATGKTVIEMNTPDDYVYIAFNHPEACDLALDFRYLHQARAWLQSADIITINDRLEIIECSEQDEWLDTLTYILDTLCNNFQELHIGGRATLAINCKNPAVDYERAEYARETLEECNFHIDYQGRSGGYMCLSYWKNMPFYCYGLDSLEKILQLVDQATGDPTLWEAFDDDLTRIVEQVEDFKSWTDENEQGEWEDEEE